MKNEPTQPTETPMADDRVLYAAYRIGNLVKWTDDKDYNNICFLTIVGLYLNDLVWVEWEWEDGANDNTDTSIESISGIELSGKIINDIGFKLDDNGIYWYNYQTHYLELQICNDGIYPTYVQVPEFSSEDEQRVSFNRINYLHELQNLIYAIRGEELSLSGI